jgi:hypothetical protein
MKLAPNGKPKPTLKLVGEDGNVMFIVARARRVMREAGWTDDEIVEYTEEALSGDYDHALQVTMRYTDVE